MCWVDSRFLLFVLVLRRVVDMVGVSLSLSMSTDRDGSDGWTEVRGMAFVAKRK